MYKYSFPNASSFECISRVTDTKNGQSDHMFAVRDVEADMLFYCVYNCHVLTYIGQETIKYLIFILSVICRFNIVQGW